MPGRVARVHGQVFEAMDLGPVAVDDEVVIRYEADSTARTKTTNAAMRQ